MPRSGLLHPRFHSDIRRSAVAKAGGFPDEITFVRPGDGPGVVSDAGGLWTPPEGTTIYQGCCRIQLDTLSQGRQLTVGDEVVTLHRYRVGLPDDAPELLPGDIGTITCTHDPRVIARPLIVRDVIVADTFLVRRTVLVEDHPNRPAPGG